MLHSDPLPVPDHSMTSIRSAKVSICTIFTPRLPTTSPLVSPNNAMSTPLEILDTQLSATAEKKRILREVLETDNIEIMAQLLEEAVKLSPAFKCPGTTQSLLTPYPFGTGFYVDGCDCVEEAHPGDHQAWLRKVYKNCMPCIELHDRLVRLGEPQALEPS
jgi:hypothetical protein